jgi:hypothetical protein
MNAGYTNLYPKIFLRASTSFSGALNSVYSGVLTCGTSTFLVVQPSGI